jgi:hypothetical protein
MSAVALSDVSTQRDECYLRLTETTSVTIDEWLDDLNIIVVVLGFE